ncbi:thiamine pyrophosphate-binding protein [Maribius pontilimi]|uniref:Thiamine pyrophosphate-binding protein n=1 Tax=Palleronia pontilimi TaxID=1964209 RepID=A0A934I6Q8_9RHOB|nr:thiamine pyrophosphate-binding protein [Palleronia pontilimi]MBJ3761198.1 thiamine pyrophosphate-binding protein [Palleronia pontilimi]
MKHGGQLLVDCLKAQGTTRVFCVPGESYLAALDGLYDSGIHTVVTRHEGGATMMAEAHGKLTGAPGIAFVTRGPGATNGASGVHVAMQDSTPMILFIGQVASDQRDREAFQEVDYRAMFAPQAKWVAEIDRTDRIPEYVSRAFHVAQSGRPGPVVLALPEDMLSAPTDAAPAPAATLPQGGAPADQIARVIDAVAQARAPFLIVGGGGWTADAARALGDFADKAQVPVGASFRCQDYLDNRHPNYAGDVGLGINPELEARVKDADLLVALGTRLGEITSGGYTRVVPPTPRQRLVHIYPDASEIGRVYRPEIAVTGPIAAITAQLAAAARSPDIDRADQVAAARASYDAWQQPIETPGDVKMERVIAHLNDALPDDAILTNGAGNYAGWLHRYYRFRGWRTQLAPTSGSMGYGLPAAIAAKLELPGRDVICLAGDGCFQMVSQEFGTACEQGANIVVLVVNNGHYGTIRMHQQKHFPQRQSGTALKNPDFAALARAYGGFGATVARDADFADAFAAARNAGVPAILDLKVSPRALSTTLTLDQRVGTE